MVPSWVIMLHCVHTVLCCCVCNCCTLQEACAVGMEASIRRDDPVISAYRVHGLCYTRGLPVKEVLGELMGECVCMSVHVVLYAHY